MSNRKPMMVKSIYIDFHEYESWCRVFPKVSFSKWVRFCMVRAVKARSLSGVLDDEVDKLVDADPLAYLRSMQVEK